MSRSPAPGEYVLNAVATDRAGVATVRDPVTVVADPVASTVNLAVGGTNDGPTQPES